MEDSWIKEFNEAGRIFRLSDKFKEICPFFMSIGMTYAEFWYEDVDMARFYLEAHYQREEYEKEKRDWNNWQIGVYVYEAFSDVSPVLHAFAKKGTKPLPFPKVPYGKEEVLEKIESKKEPTVQEVENERLKAKIFFNNWFRAMNKEHKEKR